MLLRVQHVTPRKGTCRHECSKRSAEGPTGKALADVKDLQQQAVDVRSLLIRYNHRIKQMKDKLSEVS